MVLLRYMGAEPVEVEGHPWTPQESRWVSAEEADRLLSWVPAEGARCPFERLEGERPAPVSTDVPASPTDRMIRNSPRRRPWR